MIRYASAAVCVAVSFVIAVVLDPMLPATTVFLAGVVVAAWFGGLGPGLAAAVLSTPLIDYFFIPPYYDLKLGAAHAPAIAIFALSAAFAGWAGAKRRQNEQKLKNARDATEAEVRERTADLKESNEALRRQARLLEQTHQTLEELAGRLIHAQEEERSRIGRELHDHISQRLGVLTIKIDQLRTDPSAARVADALDDLRQGTSEITDDVHRLSHRLHSSMLDHLGLVPALHRLVSEFSERHPIQIAFTSTPLSGPLPSDLALCLFRIAEESLTNIVKHSGAASARVDLGADSDGIHLRIEDSGRGFDQKILEGRAGLGFVSMRERLRLVHGTIQVQSVPEHGTRLEVWVPYVGAAARVAAGSTQR